MYGDVMEMNAPSLRRRYQSRLIHDELRVKDRSLKDASMITYMSFDLFVLFFPYIYFLFSLDFSNFNRSVEWEVTSTSAQGSDCYGRGNGCFFLFQFFAHSL